MAWRKLITRLLVLSLVGAAGVGYYFYQHYTDPAAVRQAVLAELAQQFPGADIFLGAAEMRVLGGVELTNLELSRRDEPGAGPFAILPSLILRHDKEELGRGRLVIRKIEARGPKLTLIRRADGAWNLEGITSATPSSAPPPAIEIQHGSITFLDQAAADTRFVIEDVCLKAIPSASGSIRIEASGQCDTLGPISFEGTAERGSGELALNLQFSNLPVNPALRAHLGAYLAGCPQDAFDITGKATVNAELSYRPGAAKPWSHEVAVNLREAALRHPRFPLALESVSALLRCKGHRLVLESLKAKSHGAAIEVYGEMNGLSADADFELHIKAEQLRITKDVYDKLPPQMAKICADFRPEGTMSLAAEVSQKAGRFTAGYTVTLQGMSMLFTDFPYPVDGVTGTLVFKDEGDTPSIAVKVAGIAGYRPVKVEGRVFGEGLRPDNDCKPGLHLDITGTDLPIDERGILALPEVSQRVARQFKPTGLVDVLAEVRRPAGTAAAPRPAMQSRYLLRFHDAALAYEKFPYPVENVEGTLELLTGGRWTFTGFKGTHKQGQFTGWARSSPTMTGDHIEVYVAGVNTLLDREMEAALLSPRMLKTYQLFSPQGRVDFKVKVDTIGKGQPELDLQVTARDCSMKPSCFPYLLTKVTGTFRYAKDRVSLSEFRAMHGNAEIKLGRDGAGGEVVLRPNGGYRAVLTQVYAWPLTVDADFLKALPSLAATAFETLQPDRPVRIITDLTIDDPGPGGKVTYEWNGHIAFANTRLHCGFELDQVTGLVALAGKYDGTELKADGNLVIDQMTIGKQVFRELRGEMKLTKQALVFPGIRAALHGGELYGPIRVEFGPELPYRVDLTASKIDLEQFARETLGRSGQVKGTADARLELQGKGSDLKSLRGRGSVRIAHAKLYDLPLVLDLLSGLSGRLPKGSAFQEANADFTFEGERLQIGRLELLGDALSLRGAGDMRVDGSELNLEMYGLLLGRTLPLLPPLIDQIPSWLSKRLMLIRVTGNLEKAQTKIEPVPFLVEPIRELLKSAGGRQQMDPPLRRSP